MGTQRAMTEYAALWQMLASAARMEPDLNALIEASARSELTSEDAQAAIANIRAAILSNAPPLVLSGLTAAALVNLIFWTEEQGTAASARACACVWLLWDRDGLPFKGHVLGSFLVAIASESPSPVREAVEFLRALRCAAERRTSRSLFLLGEVFLLALLASRGASELPAEVDADCDVLESYAEVPETWLLGIDGSSRTEYPWSSVIEQFEAERAALAAVLKRIGTKTESQ